MASGKYQEWLTDDGLLRIEGWARDGLTDKQIAHNMGVSEQTLNVWKKKYPSLFESLKRGKEVIDREVENALLKRALGYTIKIPRKITFMTSHTQKKPSDSPLNIPPTTARTSKVSVSVTAVPPTAILTLRCRDTP